MIGGKVRIVCTATAGLGTCATGAVVALRSERPLSLRCLVVWRRRVSKAEVILSQLPVPSAVQGAAFYE